MNEELTYWGNKELLHMKKIGYLASRKISTQSVLPALDWALQKSKRADIAIVSGFHSRMEKNVLKILLQGQCAIIVVLARCMYRKLPQQYEEAMAQNRLLIISYEKENITRVSETTAHKRNDFVRKLVNQMWNDESIITQ